MRWNVARPWPRCSTYLGLRDGPAGSLSLDPSTRHETSSLLSLSGAGSVTAEGRFSTSAPAAR